MKTLTIAFGIFATSFLAAQAQAQEVDCVGILNNAKTAYQGAGVTGACEELLNKPGVPGRFAVLGSCGAGVGSKLASARGVKDQACNQPICKQRCPGACGDHGLAAFYQNVAPGQCR